jgi:hypothetical protein
MKVPQPQEVMYLFTVLAVNLALVTTIHNPHTILPNEKINKIK